VSAFVVFNKKKINHFILFIYINVPLLQVTGELMDNLTCWDALRAALPVGTVSGAPKVIYLSSVILPSCVVGWLR
jgi:hypothetical protein